MTIINNKNENISSISNKRVLFFDWINGNTDFGEKHKKIIFSLVNKMNDAQFNSFMDGIYLDYSGFKNTIEFELMLGDLENTIDKINKETIILKIKEKELRFNKEQNEKIFEQNEINSFNNLF